MVVCYLTFWLEACDCFREKNIVEADSVSEFCELCDILHEACDCLRENIVEAQFGRELMEIGE